MRNFSVRSLLKGLETDMQTVLSILQQKEYLTFYFLAMSCSSGSLLAWLGGDKTPLDLCWPKVLVVRVSDVTWLIPLWWPDDW